MHSNSKILHKCIVNLTFNLKKNQKKNQQNLHYNAFYIFNFAIHILKIPHVFLLDKYLVFSMFIYNLIVMLSY